MRLQANSAALLLGMSSLPMIIHAFSPYQHRSHKQLSLVQRHESGRFDGDHGTNLNESISGKTFSISPGEATRRLGTMTGPTVWSQFSKLAQENDVANLGQGFPDWFPPKFAIDSLVEAAMDVGQSPHQYTRTAGHPNLVNQLAKRYSIHLRREIDAMTEVAVTIGASQALYLSLQTLINPGTWCTISCSRAVVLTLV
jgi:DNA-binding transcriptional MocR family regulator